MQKIAQKIPSVNDIVTLIKHNMNVLLMNSQLETMNVHINALQVKINVTQGSQTTPTAVNVALPLEPNQMQTNLLIKNVFAILNKAYPSVNFLVSVSGASGAGVSPGAGAASAGVAGPTASGGSAGGGANVGGASSIASLHYMAEIFEKLARH